MNKNSIFLLALATAFIAVGCSGGLENSEPTSSQTPVSQEKMEIRINPYVPSSRATDSGFENGDCIGLYVVNYSGNHPGTLTNSGNHVNNMRFSYDGTWTPDRQVTWVDNETHADFYVYYPFSSVQSVGAHEFAVKTDQSVENDYKSSDLMTGRLLNVAPTTSTIDITVNHVMSRAVIYLEGGNGFTEEELSGASISVKLNGLKYKSTVDLATGNVTPVGEPASLTPFYTDGRYMALIVPQTVEPGCLITVAVDGIEYNLQKGFTFGSGKSYKFTITLSKAQAGLNVNIIPWIDDGTDNGGTAE